LCLCFCFSVSFKIAAAPFKTDSLVCFLKINNPDLRERKLAYYLGNLFGAAPVDSLEDIKNSTDELIIDSKIANSAAFEYFIDGVCYNRHLQFDEAENALANGLYLADKAGDHYLAYNFFTFLGFIQTNSGNTIRAISSFRLANKEAILLNDAYLEVLIYINISDIYYRNNFYTQSLYYLNNALATITANNIKQQRLINVINYNKAENYFRMGNADSLRKCNLRLYEAKSGTYLLYIFKKRTDYYIQLLKHDYKNAINHITTLRKDPLFTFDNTDRQNLADAYYNAGELDSAKYITTQLLTEPEQNNHPEIKAHLYKVLGAIAAEQNDVATAATDFKLALQQSENHTSQLTEVGDISSQIKVDGIERAYIQREEVFKREKIWLIFTVVVALLTITIAFVLYRNIKQKRYYERLLFSAKKEELSFINSHEVRKHLSNILGIVEVMKHSKTKDKEYLEAEDHLLSAAEGLDAAIRNISEKLDS